ncbi:hypothetical protein GCM10011371_18860 [Novosphingobium marinum]|uniref:Uncharacterized protein n=1 Tax=Novosphingobium marinum TaxID=1514948 RepID=A0A7Y9XWQ6_9SPHN|nr:hypothetical protein [Novosphingobium marinum]NYH95999.1 hypothetical protein [Novosphingobium marinum]GGC31651.1 hypothetical protein GCM10011371_18860 [Novosphingobium marinum]
MAKTKLITKADDAKYAVKRRASKAKAKAKGAIEAVHGPSPNPKTNLVLADIALRGGSLLLRQGVERGLLGAKYSPGKAKDILKGRSIFENLTGVALARLATKSVPGAILVGGGIIAKTLYDRSKARKAKAEGEAELDEMAAEGRDS